MTETLWAVYSERGLQLETLSFTRTGAIDAYLRNVYGIGRQSPPSRRNLWNEQKRKYGMRVSKCEVTEVL